MKYTLYIDETVKFRHELVIEVNEEEISEEKFSDIINNAENKGRAIGWDAIQGELEKNNIRVLECCEDNSGEQDNVEITDLVRED